MLSALKELTSKSVDVLAQQPKQIVETSGFRNRSVSTIPMIA